MHSLKILSFEVNLNQIENEFHKSLINLVLVVMNCIRKMEINQLTLGEVSFICLRSLLELIRILLMLLCVHPMVMLVLNIELISFLMLLHVVILRIACFIEMSANNEAICLYQPITYISKIPLAEHVNSS